MVRSIGKIKSLWLNLGLEVSLALMHGNDFRYLSVFIGW